MAIAERLVFTRVYTLDRRNFSVIRPKQCDYFELFPRHDASRPNKPHPMIQIQLNLPESAFSALRSSPDEFAQELLIAAVVKWYEVGMISQSKATEIAGISRQAFFRALDRFEVSPFQTTTEELIEEVGRD